MDLPRPPRPLLPAALALLLFAAPLAGCGGGRDAGEPELTIYVGAPASGPGSGTAEEIVEGARLALEEAGAETAGVTVRLEPVGTSGGEEGYRQADVAARARTATRDSTAIGYVGEPDPDATAISAPILNEAGMLQLAPTPIDEALVRAEPGGTGVPRDSQPTGARTLGALQLAGGPGLRQREPLPGLGDGQDGEPSRATLAGYEAVAVILDSIERASDPLDRSSVIDAYLRTADRDSPLGRYSVDPVGVARFERRPG
jgi:ABC-type branched-subunit amino acid transport system substrate-binding protein